MKFLRSFLDSQHDKFAEGGKLHRFYALYEAIDTFLYTPSEVTEGEVHVRDHLDLKRLMVTVAIALIPTVLMAMYNTGYQAALGLQEMGAASIPGWRGDVMASLGFALNPADWAGNMVHGALYFVPIYATTMAVGGLWEGLFAMVRGHEINEGFLVTGLLFPLTLPATIPLWQVAMGISFGVVVGKEIFGGTGKNFLNPALTARAFVFFAYPAQISGNQVWIAADGYTGATALGQAAQGGADVLTQNFSWMNAFLGYIPGSMGETSTLACLLGATLLIMTGIGSWRVMLSMFISTTALALLFNWIGSETNPMFSVPYYWHWVIGGFAFGTIFMATDPVSASMTELGQWFYGTLIGFMVILVRVINPAFPEGVMLAILFGNVFAPLIDYFVVNSTVKRRQIRAKELGHA